MDLVSKPTSRRVKKSPGFIERLQTFVIFLIKMFLHSLLLTFVSHTKQLNVVGIGKTWRRKTRSSKL